MKKTTLLVLTTLLCGTLAAQSFYSIKRDRKFIASVGSGTSSYFGELSNDGDFIDAKLNLNFGLQYFITERISIRSEVTWFQLTGDDAEADDASRTRRNLSFVSNNYELNIEGIVNLLPKGQRFYQRKPINAYIFAGLGVVNYNPKGEVPNTEFNGALLSDAGNKVALRPLQTEGVKYGNFSLVIPMGLGVKIKAGPFINVALEGGFRKTFTDYLDDVSTFYADRSGESELAMAMADKRWALANVLEPRPVDAVRGNPDADDAYFIMNVKLEYFLPSSFFSGINKNKRPKRKRVKYSKRR
jgi:hypothetical protein